MRRSPALRRIIPAIAVGALVLAACGSDDDNSADSADSADSGDSTDETLAPSDTSVVGATDCVDTIDDGTLTIATGEPAFYPWVIDNAPETGEGFEAAVALAVAGPRWDSRATPCRGSAPRSTGDPPGETGFDFNLQQFSITDERKKCRFSPVLHRQPGRRRRRRLRRRRRQADRSQDVKFGAPVGTTSLQFITDVIQPDPEPFVYDDNVDAKAALDANQIDAVVFDLPTGALRVGSRDRGQQRVRSVPGRRRRHDRPVRIRTPAGQPADGVRRPRRSPSSRRTASSMRSLRSGCRTSPVHR